MDQLATPHVMDTPLHRPWWRKRHWVQAGIAIGLVQFAEGGIEHGGDLFP